FAAFFTEAAKSGSAVTWAGVWTEIEKTSGAPFTVAELAGRYDYEPVIIIGTHQEDGNSLKAAEPLTAANKQRFVQAIAAFAGKYKPRYIGIGNEVNRIRAKAPADYQVFKSWFAEATAAV